MLNGTGRVVLSKPTPAPTAKGRAVLKSGSSYLPGTGRVTFGVYKAGPVIYVRETY
jgi:MSHA biogenesis protein MshQ